MKIRTTCFAYAGLLLVFSCRSGDTLLPPEVRRVLFESGRFAEPISIVLPPEANTLALATYRRQLQGGGLFPLAPLGDVNPDRDPGIGFLLRLGFLSLENIEARGQYTVSYPLYAEKVQWYGQFDKRGGVTLAVGRRKEREITYTNVYKASPLGVEVKVAAVTFSYTLEPILPLLMDTRSFEGKARAYLDPDDGKWKLNNLELSDRGFAEFEKAAPGESRNPDSSSPARAPILEGGPNSHCKLVLSQTCEKSYPCVSLRIAPNSGCQYICAEKLAGELRAGGIRVGELLARDGITAWPEAKACIGHRADLGGTIEGAKCLQEVLGSDYRLHDGATRNCVSDGTPYMVGTY